MRARASEPVRPLARGAVLVVNVNRFAAVNDTLGHDVGDELLKQVGQRLRMALREEDILARIGGDEFILLLNSAPDARRDHKAFEGMRRDMAHKLPALDISGPITFSMGRAVYPDDALTANGLLSHADAAMYIEKEHAKAMAKP